MAQVSEHEWVENFSEYEAVLRCTNSLGPWDKEVSLRAFQTFGWDDASTVGNDLAFVHSDSGLTVRHDGSVVAIDFGDAKLVEALPDLFSVLHGLGWRFAEVFHPIETMGTLLSDIGKSIPARMDFDVSPAKGVTAISEFAEATTLVERGRAVLQSGGMSSHNSVVLGELESMGEAAAVGAAAVRPGPIVLLDDEENGGAGTTVAVKAHESVGTKATRPQIPASSFSGDEEHPQIFSLSAGAVSVERPAALEVEVNEHALGQRPIQHVQQPQSSADFVGVGDVTKDLQAERKSTMPVDVRPAELDSAAAGNSAPFISSGGVVSVGLSTFCFDVPGAQISDIDVREIASQYGIEEIVSLRPGAIGEGIRWDVLGEIASEFPWFAELLIGAMDFGAKSGLQIASMVLALKKAKPNAQLRDLLDSCTASRDRALAGDAPLDHLRADDLSQAIVRRLGGLLLCPAGQAFVDVRSSDDDQPSAVQEAFTVRGALQSPATRLFVVHVDSLDGAFVRWIAELLRFVVIAHSTTMRYSKAVKIKDEKAETALKIGLLQEEVKGVVGGLIAQLRELGCEV